MEMRRYYHVAPDDYREGDDLYSYDALVSQGRNPRWKWDQIHAETNVLALFCHTADARTFRQNHGGSI